MALNYVQIGRRVCQIRKRRGLTQAALAEMIKRSPTYISYIEGGLKNMSLETFVSIANALQVSADELLMDSIENTIRVSNHEFAKVIADCSTYEKQILLAVAVSLKTAIRENRHYLIKRYR